MSTALFEVAMSVPGRLSEINILIESAKAHERQNEKLYNAICRATSVLLASHLEGFLKDASSSIIADLNYNLGTFSKMPEAMRRTFCEKIAFYEGVAQSEINERIKQLDAFFAKNSVPIDPKAFSYKEAPNKNATSAFIDNTFNRFGIPNIVYSMSSEKLKSVFDNDRFSNYVISRELVRFRSLLYSFPYKPVPDDYKFTYRATRSQGKTDDTIWHTYIEEVMARRHKVAHGDTLENETTWEELKRASDKLGILMQGLTLSAASYLSDSLSKAS